MTQGLIANLAVALIAALLGAVIALRLRQSAVIGYIAAGIAIGPFTPGLVLDPHAVEEVADLGLVFLLFTIGAELSLRDLLRAGKVALLGGAVQVVATIGIGYGVAIWLGWDTPGALFFGAALAISSGAVLSKILGERGELEAEHGRIALAWSTIQDLATIVLVVLLPAIAHDSGSRSGSGSGSGSSVADVALALGKAGLFLAILVPTGLKLFPALFEWLAGLRNRELFVLAVAAVALGTAYVSTLFGVSLALGAFVAGLVVGESDLSHHVLAEIMPLRDVLAGLFFVSIGMLVDPPFVLANWALIVLALVLMVLIKGAVVGSLSKLLGASGRTAVLVGMAMAQCGEFSFLLARLGRETGAVSGDGFNLILSGAAASILVAPPLHNAAGQVVRSVERRLSARALALDVDVDVNVNVNVKEPAASEGLSRRHAVICGYGDVGRLVGEALQRRGFSFVAIDQDPRVVRRARAEGGTAVLGSADNPVLLEHAGLDRARVLVVTIPDALAARQIVEYARRAWPKLDIVARTRTQEQMRDLQTRGVNEAVSAELELALEMARHTLRRFGVSNAETLAILHGFRTHSE